MERIGFLTFGWHSASPSSRVRTAAEALHDTVRLAEAAEDAGMDGGFLRVHHWQQSLASPFPILTAMGMRTERLELGTGVINMRYENPLYMAELAATADLLVGGRLQLGLSRGSPESVTDGIEQFGYPLAEDDTPVADAARRIALFRHAIAGGEIAEPASGAAALPGHKVPIHPQSPGLAARIWYGAGNTESARNVGQLGMNLMSSTLVLEATGEPLGVVQNRQIEAFREAWREAGHQGEPRVSVSRSIMPIVDDQTRQMFSPYLEKELMGANRDYIGELDNATSTFGKTYVGEIDKIVAELREDDAVMNADTLMVTVPNQLGADFNHVTFKAFAEIKRALA